jgi:hypothetical protein
MKDYVQVKETAEEGIKRNLEEILSLSFPHAEYDLTMAKINAKADECIKLVDSIRK